MSYGEEQRFKKKVKPLAPPPPSFQPQIVNQPKIVAQPSQPQYSLFSKEEEKEGKQLTISQIKKAYNVNQQGAIFHNKDISDEAIRNFVIDVLVTRGNVTPDTARDIMDSQGVKIMKRAFTHWTVPNELNYEVLETLGDTTFNKIVMYYMIRRFPELHNDPQANYKLTEAGKLYHGRKMAEKFSDILELPKMARWIEGSYEISTRRGVEKRKIEMDDKFKTDLLEAFIGGLEDLIDGKVFPHMGYTVAYSILQTVLDTIPMTIELSETKTAPAKITELMNRLDGSRDYRKRKDSENNIIGVDLTLYFNNGISCASSRDLLYEKHFYSGVMKGYEAGEDKVANMALEWLDKECNKQWKKDIRMFE